MTTGNKITFWLIWLSAIGLLIIAKFFPEMITNVSLTETRSEMPWWSITVFSLPVFLVWSLLLIKELKGVWKNSEKIN